MPDIAPAVPIRQFPEAEQKYIFFINSLLSDLDLRCQELHAAVALFDMGDKKARIEGVSSEDFGLAVQWIFMAVRETAAAIYKFDEDMSMLGANINRCPTLLSKIDSVAKREATARFKTNFPNTKALRDSCQHGGTLNGSPEKLAEHTDGRLFQMNNIVNNTYMTTFRKKHVHLEISLATHAELKEVRDLYWAVFWQLSHP